MAAAKYMEIYISLRERIESGAYAFRDFLPSENALAQEFGVTRNTLRKALAHLTNQGYVQAMQGRGVQVTYRPQRRSRFFLSGIESFAEACRRLGLVGRTVLLSSQRITVDEELADSSGLPAGSRALSLVRLRFLDERPVIVDRSWFLADVVPSIPDHAATSSVYAYLEARLGIRAFSSTRMVTIEPADELDREHLDLAGLDCVGVIEALCFDASGRLFEYTLSHHVPEIFGFLSVARRLPAHPYGRSSSQASGAATPEE